MEAVYILEPGSYIRRRDNCLHIVKAQQVISQIPCQDLKRLILVGFINLTGAVLDFLIQHKIETVFMTPTGRFRARLGIDEHRHVALRKAQYLGLHDPGMAARTARIIVDAKIQNMTHLLRLRGRQYDDEVLRAAAASLNMLGSRLEKADTLENIRGLEGAASRSYFQCFGRLIRNPQFTFTGRNRRPPLDPVNALLSFIYTLLTNEVLSAINAAGLDPYLGALHEISYGRPSLACDLVEEYRVFLADRMVLGLINRRAISPEDFICRNHPPKVYTDEKHMRARRPVEMRPPMARTFIASYEHLMNQTKAWGPKGRKSTYRMLILRQVRAFAAFLENPERPYVPFVWRV